MGFVFQFNLFYNDIVVIPKTVFDHAFCLCFSPASRPCCPPVHLQNKVLWLQATKFVLFILIVCPFTLLFALGLVPFWYFASYTVLFVSCGPTLSRSEHVILRIAPTSSTKQLDPHAWGPPLRDLNLSFFVSLPHLIEKGLSSSTTKKRHWPSNSRKMWLNPQQITVFKKIACSI